MTDSINIGAALINQIIAARDPNVQLASELMATEAAKARVETEVIKDDHIAVLVKRMNSAVTNSEKGVWERRIEALEKL